MVKCHLLSNQKNKNHSTLIQKTPESGSKTLTDNAIKYIFWTIWPYQIIKIRFLSIYFKRNFFQNTCFKTVKRRICIMKSRTGMGLKVVLVPNTGFHCTILVFSVSVYLSWEVSPSFAKLTHLGLRLMYFRKWLRFQQTCIDNKLILIWFCSFSLAMFPPVLWIQIQG